MIKKIIVKIPSYILFISLLFLIGYVLFNLSVEFYGHVTHPFLINHSNDLFFGCSKYTKHSSHPDAYLISWFWDTFLIMNFFCFIFLAVFSIIENEK